MASSRPVGRALRPGRRRGRLGCGRNDPVRFFAVCRANASLSATRRRAAGRARRCPGGRAAAAGPCRRRGRRRAGRGWRPAPSASRNRCRVSGRSGDRAAAARTRPPGRRAAVRASTPRSDAAPGALPLKWRGVQLGQARRRPGAASRTSTQSLPSSRRRRRLPAVPHRRGPGRASSRLLRASRRTCRCSRRPGRRSRARPGRSQPSGSSARVGHHLAVHAQPGHAAVRVDGQPHVGEPRAGTSTANALRLSPASGERGTSGAQSAAASAAGVRVAVEPAALDRGVRRVVAGEERGVDDDAVHHAGRAEPDDRPVVAGRRGAGGSPSRRTPGPWWPNVCGVNTGGVGGDEVVGGGEELVVGGDDPAAERPRRQVGQRR